MPKASRDALKSKGKTDIYYIDPNDLVLVEDKGDLLYDARVEDPVNESLVANIMYAPDGKTSLGIIQPVTGVRNRETGKVEIVAGRDRVKAAREANLRLKKQGRPPIYVPTWLRRIDDSHVMATLVSENEQRRADTPLNRAQKMQRYMNLGHGEKETAQLFGVSEATVKNMTRLLDAPAAVRNALDAGKIAASDAYRLAREEPADARKKLTALLEQAPRTPGKKHRSKDAAKARAILRGPERAKPPKAPPPDGRITVRGLVDGVEKMVSAPIDLGATTKFGRAAVESAAAEAIAAWIEKNWNDGAWGGSPASIPDRIRNGEWRTNAKDGDDDGERQGSGRDVAGAGAGRTE